MRGSRWRNGVVLLAGLLACAACGDDDEPASSRSDAGMRRDAAARGGPSDAGAAFDAREPSPIEPLPPLDLVPPDPGSIGAACAQGDECDAGSCRLAEPITSTPYPGGYCTGPCNADVDCSASGLCVPGFRGRMGSCARRCTRDEECGRDGYRCRVVSDAGRCTPGPRPLPDHAVGRACAHDDDCGGGPMTCASALGAVAAPDGYCSQACAIDEDCGAGGRCINGLSLVTLPTGVCYRACVVPEPCRAGYECRSLSGASDGPGVCAPLAR
jgi:hypothetical protein